nr:hypothetical protein [Schistosoma japonicum]
MFAWTKKEFTEDVRWILNMFQEIMGDTSSTETFVMDSSHAEIAAVSQTHRNANIQLCCFVLYAERLGIVALKLIYAAWSAQKVKNDLTIILESQRSWHPTSRVTCKDTGCPRNICGPQLTLIIY